MKELKAKMYGYKTKNTKSEKIDETKLTTAKDSVLIESLGQRHLVPNMSVFLKLTQEHDILKTNHNKAVKELNVLRESVKVMIVAINEMNEELKKKIDKLD